jgi:hypothetical protein
LLTLLKKIQLNSWRECPKKGVPYKRITAKLQVSKN